jgi:uncharacterized protein YjbI with pentapeptide repeats
VADFVIKDGGAEVSIDITGSSRKSVRDHLGRAYIQSRAQIIDYASFDDATLKAVFPVIDVGRHMQIDKKTFDNVKSIGSHRTFADLELVRCEFTGSNLSQFDDPELGLVVRDVTATRCLVRRSSMNGARLENVLVDGLTTTGTVMLQGCVFRRVTLRGRVGSLMVMPPNFGLEQAMQKALADGIVRFYQDVDWALDISEAEFTEANLYYVPGDLVKRDPETQYLLRRDSFTGIPLDGLPVRARIAVDRFESTPFDSIVAVAPTRSKDFAKVKEALDELRARGLAE